MATSVTLREIITRWGFDVDDSALLKLRDQQKKLQANFVKLGAVATAALAAVVVPAAGLEDALRRSVAAAGLAGPAFDTALGKLTGKAQDFAEELGISGTKVAEGFFDVISAGVDPLSKGFDKFAETGLRLAKVAGGDVGQAIEQLKPAMQAFGITTENAIIVADKFAKANQLGATSVAQVAEAMTLAGPIASQVLGASLDTTTAALIGFAEAGFRGRRGGESLKQVVLALSAPTTRARRGLEELGIVTTDDGGKFLNLIDIFKQFEKRLVGMTDEQKAFSLEQIFGRETVGKFTALLSVGTDKLRDFETGLGESDGALALALVQMEGTTEAGRRLIQSLKNLAITFGTPLLGPIKSFSDLLRGMTRRLRDFADENPKLVKVTSTIFGFVATSVILGSVLGIMTVQLKLAVIAMKLLGKATLAAQAKMIALPILVAAIGIAFGLLLVDLFRFASGSESVIGDIVNAWGELGVVLQGTIGLLFAVGLAALSAASPLLALVILVLFLAVSLQTLINNWDDVVWAFRTGWEDIKNLFKNGVEFINKELNKILPSGIVGGAVGGSILSLIPGVGSQLALAFAQSREAGGVTPPGVDAAATTSINNTRNSGNNINITAPVSIVAEGANAEEVAAIVRDEFGNIVRDATDDANR